MDQSGARMIREATHEDISSILVMGRKFFDLAGWPEIAEWDVGSVIDLLERLIAAPAGFLFVVDDGEVRGMAGGMVVPFCYNTAVLVGHEQFFWVEPEARGRDSIALFDALENAARDRGARGFSMFNIEGLKSDALARLYRRRGYKVKENTFMKVF